MLFLLLTNGVCAQQKDAMLTNIDSVDISLLTCQPRDAVYSLYGHTALRITCKDSGIDYTVNYGLFSFSKPYFILRFVFGLTDYEVGACSFDDFKYEYESVGCGVRQQVLNLTAEEKLAVLKALDVNLLPENRTYRYNYFYDNCTTRVRDIIINGVRGKVNYREDYRPTTYREMIHSYNENHRWARFGNDLLLGVKADEKISFAQHQFLPFSLSDDFEKAFVTDSAGRVRRLVSQTKWAVPPGAVAVDTDSMPSPRTCALIMLALVIGFCVLDYRRGRITWAFDAFLMTLSGLAGLILLAMVFSSHPTVSLNLQILLLNPLALAFAYPTVRGLRRCNPTLCMTIWPSCIVLFFVGGFLQTYAEGMYIVALSLLVRILFIVLFIRRNSK